MSAARGGRAPLAECHGDQPLMAGSARNVASLLAQAADRAPECGVVTIGTAGTVTRLNYPELLGRARGILGRLRGLGWAAGQTILLYGIDLPDFFPALWACLIGGLVPLPISADDGSPAATAERMRNVWRRLGEPPVLAGQAAATALAARPEAGGTKVWQPADWAAWPAAAGGHDLREASPAGSQPALLLLSSGSTGAAKIIPLTHDGLLEFAGGSRQMLDWRPGETTLNWLPIDHSASLLLYHLLPVFIGCTNVHVPTEQVLADPLRWFDLIGEYQASHSWAPTFGYQMARSALAATPARAWDLSCVRSLVSGGEMITTAVVDGFLAAAAPAGISADCFVPAWGMAETCTGITWGRYGEPGSVHRVRRSSLGGQLTWSDDATPESDCVTFVSVGRPAPGASLRVVDERQRVLPEGVIGRLQIRSGRVTPGYLADELANAVAFPAGGPPSARWFDTGDLAFICDGQLVVTGREKDIVIIGGKNHSCQNIEAAIADVPGVADRLVAACAMPDREAGSEALAVFFAPDEAVRPAADTARAIGAGLLSQFGLAPGRVVPLTADRFPRTASGKLRRKDLVCLIPVAADEAPVAQDGQPGTTDLSCASRRAATLSSHRQSRSGPLPGSAELVEVVRRGIGDVLGRPAVPGDDSRPFFELGLTSVTLTRLHDLLERDLGFSFPRSVLFDCGCATELLRWLAGAMRQASARAATDPAVEPCPDERRRNEPCGNKPRASQPRPDQPIAIIGMALRFPGADNADEYWSNLSTGTDCVTVFDRAAQRAAGLSDEQIADPDRRPVCGALGCIDAFDPGFFGMSPKEAALTHPAHRLFLECCYEALESAGYADPAQRGATAVFAGAGMTLYGYQHPLPGADADLAEAMLTTLGTQADFLASRAAYRLSLTGPAVGVQTACSTSLVAVHLASQALRTGDAEMALAGAAAVHLPQEAGYLVHPGSVLSATGRCRPFDAQADGTVGGNGVGVVLLKPLTAALADGDFVHAVIAGSAVNNDGGRKVGFTAPSVGGQRAAVSAALCRAAVTGDALCYVEAHGTGTPMGDPVEFDALSGALRSASGRTEFCAVGSVKSGIGHLDTCSGMAGLIKVVLMLKHRMGVPTPNLRSPSPELEVTGGPLTLATRAWPLVPHDGEPLRAGVSCLGVGGTNAFAVVQEPPAPPALTTAAEHQDLALVPLSGNNHDAMLDLAARLRNWLVTHDGTAAANVAASMAARPARTERAVVAGRSAAELAGALSDLLAGRPGAYRTGRAADAELRLPVFAFSGQGSGYPGMARAHYDEHPVMREVLDECDAAYRSCTGSGLLPILLTGDARQLRLPADAAQSALFALQVGLAAVWRSCGVDPGCVLGYSLGEIAALCVAGALPVREGVRFTALRARLMTASADEGGMLAVRGAPELVDAVAGACGLEVAIRGGPRQQVLAGGTSEIQRCQTMLARRGVPCRALDVGVAFHSARLDAVLPRLAEAAKSCELGRLRVPFVSGLDGATWEAGRAVDPEYLVRQARQPVRFDLALAALDAAGCRAVVEVGPGDELARLGRRARASRLWLASHDGSIPLAAAELFCQGTPVAWQRLTADGRRMPLPSYPFQRVDLPGPGTRPKPGDQPKDDTMGEEFLDALLTLIAGQLGLDPGQADPDQTLVGLGADSLTMVAMTREIERQFGVQIGVREMFTDADTPRKLARSMAGCLPVSPPSQPASQPTRTAMAAEPAGPDSPLAAPFSSVTPVPDAAAGRTDVAEIFTAQLRLAGDLANKITQVIADQLDVLRQSPPAATRPTHAACARAAAGPAPAVTPNGRHPVPPAAEPGRDTRVTRPAGRARSGCDISLYFFGDYPDQDRPVKYHHILTAAEFADANGFHAIWLPERHFHSFGALFPNPSVLAAAIAVRTSRIGLRAGSVVLPLHNPIRVAEEWSVVDNLSGGRVGLCLASGWHANDFVLAPDNYGRHKEVMYEHLDTVRRLWAGEAVTAVSGSGEQIQVRTLPRPVQAQPPLFTAIVGNPDSIRRAARHDLGIVTNLMAQSTDDLAVNVALYRRTRAEAGLDPDGGRVVVLVHTYLGDDQDLAREEAFAPFCQYLRSSLSLLDRVTNSLGFDVDLARTPPEDVDFLLGRAYQRYCAERALIGSPESCREVVAALTAAGADEIGCLIDFGVPEDRMLAALPALARVRDEHAPSGTPRPDRATSLPAARLPEPARTGGDGGFALSGAQRRLWLLDRMYPGQRSYHEPKAVLLDGPLDLDVLRGALERVIARQPLLRVVFREVGGEPRQFPQPAGPVPCPLVDCSGARPEDAVRALADAERETNLDLSRGPLLRAKIARLAPDRHILFLLAHHIVFDSQSTAIFVADLAACYRAWPHDPADLPGLPPPEAVHQPADSQRAAEGLVFWTRELADLPELNLPADHPRPTAGAAPGAHLVRELGADRADQAADVARAHGCTMFMTLLAALAAVLGRLSGQDDVVLGTAVSNRPPGTEDLIGMFVDIVVLRMDTSGNPGVAELLGRVRERCARAYQHREVSFDHLVSVLNPPRVAGVNPLFGVMVEFEHEASARFDLPGLRADVLEVPSDRALFDLSFALTRHAGGLRCTVEYNAELFDPSTVSRMLDYLQAVLHRMAVEPAAHLASLTRITEQDSTALAAANGTQRPGPGGCLHELVERQAKRAPDATALIADEQRLSYRELDTAADRLAHRLARHGVGRGAIVAVCLPSGPALVIALLAVLKAGAAYLPLDPAQPLQRLESQAACAVLLLADTGIAGTGGFGGVPVLAAGEDAADLPGTPPRPVAGPDDLAYCIYTSGSSGPPKAVAMPHRGPANLVRWQLSCYQPLRTLQWTSVAFDLSVQEIFSTLASGAALVTISDAVRGDWAALGQELRKHEVQRLFMPFGALKHFVAAGERIPSLREVFAGGEQVVITQSLRDFLAAHPQVKLFNQYGPTEAAVIVTSHQVRDTGGSLVPIGQPIDNVTVRVLDPAGEEVPVGAIGELHIGGEAVAAGYLGSPAATAAGFTPDPDGAGRRLYRTGDLVRWRSDGELEFRGRRDDQVKIRGHRVAPADVRRALNQLPGVRDSAVVARPDSRGDLCLAAYVVPASTDGPDFLPMLRDELRAVLPSYLIPDQWTALPELPLRPNGKLGERLLPAPGGQPEIAAEPPATPTERRLHALWCAELGLPAIGRDDSFMDNGGNSLTAVRVLGRVREEFGEQLPLADFLSQPSIRGMARMVNDRLQGTVADR